MNLSVYYSYIVCYIDGTRSGRPHSMYVRACRDDKSRDAGAARV